MEGSLVSLASASAVVWRTKKPKTYKKIKNEKIKNKNERMLRL
jgi:hypothetical protein